MRAVDALDLALVSRGMEYPKGGGRRAGLGWYTLPRVGLARGHRHNFSVADWESADPLIINNYLENFEIFF